MSGTGDFQFGCALAANNATLFVTDSGYASKTGAVAAYDVNSLVFRYYLTGTITGETFGTALTASDILNFV